MREKSSRQVVQVELDAEDARDLCRLETWVDLTQDAEDVEDFREGASRAAASIDRELEGNHG